MFGRFVGAAILTRMPPPRVPAMAAAVGGAIIPLVTGGLADGVGLNKALLLPALCYVAIVAFAWACAVLGVIDRRSA